MKILMIIATGAIFTFPMDDKVKPDCFSQGYAVLEKISTYQDSGPEQGWYLHDSNVQVAGFYCQ